MAITDGPAGRERALDQRPRGGAIASRKMALREP